MLIVLHRFIKAGANILHCSKSACSVDLLYNLPLKSPHNTQIAVTYQYVMHWHVYCRFQENSWLASFLFQGSDTRALSLYN